MGQSELSGKDRATQYQSRQTALLLFLQPTEFSSLGIKVMYLLFMLIRMYLYVIDPANGDGKFFDMIVYLTKVVLVT